MKKQQPVFRILIVEDDPGRAQLLKSWMPNNVRTVIVSSAGKAIGLIKRDRGNVYAGIMLDHDLTFQPATTGDQYFSGTDVVNAIINNISRNVSILVHSMNYRRAAGMITKLQSTGYWVTRISMENLTRENLSDWVEEVRDIWDNMLMSI